MADLPQTQQLSEGGGAGCPPTPTPVTPSPSSSKPPLLSLHDYAEHARRVLPPPTFAYYDSGAGDELTLRLNSSSLSSFLIRPRYLVDVSSISLSSRLLGLSLPSPLLLAPTAMQGLAHPDGELSTARAAASRRLPLCLSTFSHHSLESVRSAAPSLPLLFQLYAYNSPSLTSSLISRASDAAYHALMLTVDTPAIGVRDREVNAAFRGSPAHLPLANFTHPALRALPAFPVGQVAGPDDPWARSAAVTWQTVRWMRGMTGMRLVLKGVMTPEDAVEAARQGVDAVVVSNHGGRQLDGVPATCDVLPGIVDAVRGWEAGEGGGRGRMDIVVDGGVRRGTDVFKLLALGADAVMIGRPVLWGLAYAGEEGVGQVIDLLTDELRLCMALAGCADIAAITRSRLTTREAMRPKL